MMEWRKIRNFENFYEVSNTGLVRSVARSVGSRVLKSKIRKTKITTHGYERIDLWKHGKSEYHYVHRLVADAFLKFVSAGHEVNHKDGDKRNNRVSNLEWVTKSENALHAYQTGLSENCREAAKRTIARACAAAIEANSKPVTAVCVSDPSNILEFPSVAATATKGFAPRNAGAACNGSYGRNKNLYRGYQWRFAA